MHCGGLSRRLSQVAVDGLLTPFRLRGKIPAAFKSAFNLRPTTLLLSSSRQRRSMTRYVTLFEAVRFRALVTMLPHLRCNYCVPRCPFYRRCRVSDLMRLGDRACWKGPCRANVGLSVFRVFTESFGVGHSGMAGPGVCADGGGRERWLGGGGSILDDKGATESSAKSIASISSPKRIASSSLLRMTIALAN